MFVYGLMDGGGIMMKSKSPLETKRFYKVKNPKKHFLCALCSAPRQLKYTKNLSGLNYLQILILSAFFIWIFYPLMEMKAFSLIFPIWLIVEFGNKILYRRGIPCPYCGFDATWYRRDVKVANKIVKDFWKTNYPELANIEKVGELEGSDVKIEHAKMPESDDAQGQSSTI